MDSGMKRSHSLIHKTMSQFFICTAVIFLLTAPVFYLLTKHFYAEELIEVIQAVENGGEIPPLDLERDIMAGVMMQFILTFMVLSVAMFITVRFITRRLWKPFDDTLRKAEEFNLAQSAVPGFADTDIMEFRRLNDTLQQLMGKDKETFRIQKEFTENASHELQTPLAVTRSKLDLLMQENLTEAQLGIVAELYRLNTRMGHLNRNLLLLARIENEQYDRRDDVCVAEFVESLLPSYEALRGNATVRIIAGDTAPWSVRANAILLECLFNNLVVNAIRHTTGGEISIDVSRPGTIAVSNPATGGALDPATVFRRFRRGTGEGGNGLGLAIVKAICDFHGWTAEYAFADGAHCFTIHLIFLQ